MSPDPHPGEGVQIPCRHCGGAMMKTVAAEGATTVTCPLCREQTRVKMTKSGGSLQVRTSREDES